MKPIVVWAPTYANCSAGIRACYRLVDDINALGCKASVHQADGPEPDPSDSIFVYPDIYAGDPGRGAGVVRWLLGPEKYPPGPDDLVFAWPGADDGSRPRLCVPVIETDLFRPKTQPGSGAVGWQGKGSLRTSTWLPQWIRHYDPPTREGLAQLLAGAALLVSMDARSLINTEATMCGTGVRLYDPLPDHRGLFPTQGLAFRDDEVAAACDEAASGAAFEYYVEHTLAEIRPDVIVFLEMVEARFG